VTELARFDEGQARVVVSRDGDDLVFWSDFDDYGKSIVSESRIAVVDYVAKGQGPWPWFDLGDRQAGALKVFEALGIAAPRWTEPLPPKVLTLFERSAAGWASIADLLESGCEPNVLDACGASPLWYAVRALDPAAALVLIDAGADAARRIERSALGEQFTTILHEIVLDGRTTALGRALARGADPSPRDSQGATPMHSLDDRSDHVNPGMVRALAAAGADVDATTASGQRPIEAAAQRLLTATVAAMLDLGALPAEAISWLLMWWTANARWSAHRADAVVDVIEVLRAGGARVTDRHRALAAEAGVPKVVAALDE
jgi:hypothetical protein